ncbi:glycosyltransferase [Bacillus sp. EB106-08-02-XG196]|uniref:glycosyltransferase n=1 Tax=Bacillus sp. EB106-08-02-XG196 TaxID=2737049 RepID=UPI0015C41908|nr:glycosyltransferase [Bacillus sp. EB106-08-02-XG196]NWQ41095.1 glycosyltransferase [Bacillus sp. EB106-08-02-XG196]
MEKILFITNRIPFPNTDGRKNILLQYIGDIKKLFPNAKIFNYTFVDDMKFLEKKPEIISNITILKRPGLIEKAYNLLVCTLILRKFPIQVSLFYSRKTHKQILKEIEIEKPNLIIYDMVRVSEYVRGMPKDCIHILNYDDLLSLRYKRQIQWLEYIPSVIGGFANKIPKVINGVFNSKSIQGLILKIESELLKRYELRVNKYFHHLVFTSPKEADDFKKLSMHPSCEGIPMHFPNSKIQSGPQEVQFNKIVFVGKMDIPHNVAAVMYFCEKIFPAIKKEMPDIKFHIVGKSPNKSIINLEKQFSDVYVTGEIEDLQTFIIDAGVFVAPLLFGTGIKTKIIEALSLGIPVVTTPIGAEGIVYKNEQDLFVTENDNQFAKYIIDLVNNHDRNINARRYANNFFQENYTSEHNIGVWERVLKHK